MRQPSRGFNLRLHIRNHPLNGLKLANVFAKGLALLRVLDGFFQRPLREADSLRGDPDAPAIQRAESNLQPLPFFPQPDSLVELSRMVTEKVAVAIEGSFAATGETAVLAMSAALGRAGPVELATGMFSIAEAATDPARRQVRA